MFLYSPGWPQIHVALNIWSSCSTQPLLWLQVCITWFLVFCGARDGTEGFMHARQAHGQSWAPSLAFGPLCVSGLRQPWCLASLQIQNQHNPKDWHRKLKCILPYGGHNGMKPRQKCLNFLSIHCFLLVFYPHLGYILPHPVLQSLNWFQELLIPDNS